MSEKLKAGQVWVRGDESFLVLWANGESGIRAVEQKFAAPPMVWSRRSTPSASDVVKPVLDFIKLDDLDDLIRDGWSLDAEGREVSDE